MSYRLFAFAVLACFAFAPSASAESWSVYVTTPDTELHVPPPITLPGSTKPLHHNGVNCNEYRDMMYACSEVGGVRTICWAFNPFTEFGLDPGFHSGGDQAVISFGHSSSDEEPGEEHETPPNGYYDPGCYFHRNGSKVGCEAFSPGHEYRILSCSGLPMQGELHL